MGRLNGLPITFTGDTMLTLTSLEQRINSIYSLAILGCTPVDVIRKNLESQVYSELNRRYKSNVLPKGRLVYSSYMRGYAFGIVTAHNTHIMQNLVEFCYLHEGKLYSTRKNSINPYWQDTIDGQTIRKCTGNLYWKGTNKPYTVD